MLNIKLFRENFWAKSFSILNFWSWLLFAFLILWGYNYQRPEVKDRLGFGETQLRSLAYVKMAENSLKRLEKINYSSIDIDTYIDPNMEFELREAQTRFLQNLGYTNAGNAKIKRIYPKGFLKRLGISGIYLPWIGQGNVDASLSNVEYPFIAAHEMAHAYGVTNEGEASFVAFQTCWASKNDLFRYSGELYLIRHLLFEFKRREDKLHQAFLEKLPAKIKYDLQMIKDNNDQYPDLFPKLSDAMNDKYLKTQGIESGSQSYGDLLWLLYKWENRP